MSQSQLLQGKVVVITGAGGEIGRAAALLFADEGARLVVSDLDAAAAAATAQLAANAGAEVIAVATDIGNHSSVDELMEATVKKFGRLDCAFNNAGINLATDDGTNMEAFEKSMTVNAVGTMYCQTAEVSLMLKTGGGAIVNNASVMGLVGSTRQPGYAASKHAVIGLTKTGALRWASQGIRVNAVCPGAVRTAMTEGAMGRSPELRARLMSMSPTGRLAEVDEIAQAALWLCSDRASFINGVALAVDGGFTAG